MARQGEPGVAAVDGAFGLRQSIRSHGPVSQNQSSGLPGHSPREGDDRSCKYRTTTGRASPTHYRKDESQGWSGKTGQALRGFGRPLGENSPQVDQPIAGRCTNLGLVQAKLARSAAGLAHFEPAPALSCGTSAELVKQPGHERQPAQHH